MALSLLTPPEIWKSILPLPLLHSVDAPPASLQEQDSQGLMQLSSGCQGEGDGKEAMGFLSSFQVEVKAQAGLCLTISHPGSGHHFHLLGAVDTQEHLRSHRPQISCQSPLRL
jgi:hypothetical protein